MHRLENGKVGTDHCIQSKVFAHKVKSRQTAPRFIALPFLSCTPVCEHACAYVFDMSLTVADTRESIALSPLPFDPVSRAIGISDPQTSGHEHSKIRAVNAAIGDQLTDTLRLITPIQTFSA